MPMVSIGWEPPGIPMIPKTGSGSVASQSQFHSGTFLEEMMTVPDLMEPKAGFGQTQAVHSTSTIFANIVSCYAFSKV